MNEITFTIITVCYNAERYLKDTIRSVLNQSYNNIEYIIKDGGSTDHSAGIAEKMMAGDNRIKFIQGKDEGIYDAMNKAVSLARGEYVLFLNAGDELIGPDVLKDTAKFISGYKADMYYGDIVEVGEKIYRLRKYTDKNSKLWYYSLGACLCHQSLFAKRELFKRKSFDLQYQVCADREWEMYLIRDGATTKAMGVPVAKVLIEGFSRDHIEELKCETERCIANYYKQGLIVYKGIEFLKKNIVLQKMIQKIEKTISCK